VSAPGRASPLRSGESWRRGSYAFRAAPAEEPAREARGGLRGPDVARSRFDQAPQAISQPLLVLKPAGVQKGATLRYHAWYVRVPGCATFPRADTDG